MTGLEHLFVEQSSFKEIFPEELPINPEGQAENTTRVKKLTLNQLHELQHICKEGWQINPILEVLEYLRVDECSNLKNLIPSSVTLDHLTFLDVQNCKGLIYLITSSTARSLVKLTTLKIGECGSVEQIVKEVGEGSKNEIAFKSLEVLELESLPKLKMFCSSSTCCLKLPVLEKLVIRQCARMKSFSANDTSAPLLREILIDEQDEKWFCEGNLNSTMKKMFEYKLHETFRSSERLELSEYPELRELGYSHVQSGVFGNLKDLVVHKCDFLSKFLLPLNLLKALSHLETLEVSECDSLEAMFDLSNISGKEVSMRETIQLRSIILSNLPKLKHIWKQNFQEIVSFRETTEDGCIQHRQSACPFGQVVLPNLEKITIEEMKILETVWHPILGQNLMANFKTLEINKCGKVEIICPLYMKAAFTSLETLIVTECSSVKEIFQLGTKDEDTGTAQLKNVTLLRLPQLQQIWSRDPQTSLRFCNLKVVRVEHCDALEHLLPFFIAMDLLQLEQVTIKYAGKMKEIVSGKGRPLDCPPRFEFNRLSSLVLWSSPELRGFFPKNHSLACPLLKILDVRTCLKWSLFKKQGTISEGKVLDGNPQVSTQQSPFLKEVICNLEKLALNYEDASVIVQGQFSGEQFHKLRSLILSRFEDEQARFPYWFLPNIISLEEMVVENSSFKEIFQHELQNGIQTRIKKLRLIHLHELIDICKEGFQIDPVLEVLEHLRVKRCSKLNHLVPSSVSLSYLTYLEIQNCSGLLHLINSSTARSLIKLKAMKIRACNSLEQVIPEENEETVNEIAFSSLQVLELECLPRFNIFCSSKCVLKLPLLTKLIVSQCPRMKSFSVSKTSAPILQKILTDKQDEKWFWEGDLNSTVDKIFQDMVAFSSFNHLEFSEYPELKELWYGHIGQKIFCNLKHLVVRKCTFLSKVIFSSNLIQLLYSLEELEVSECDSLETVFDVKALDDKAIMESKKVSGLKKLKLSGLPNLKHIWNREAGEIISFENLQIVKVNKCQHLKYLFLVSHFQDLRQLEELNVESCGVEEIVSIKEGLEERKFDFPRLTILRLIHLTQLTNFCPERYTLECPSLKILNVSGCEELQMFAFDHLNSKPLGKGDIELQIQQALFCIEKVSQNLEELSLNEKNTMRILNGNYEKNLFQRVKILRLRHFQETPMKFLNDLIQKFPATTSLEVRSCSFEKLFPSKEIGDCSIESPTQIKNLWLYQLKQLEHIWSDDDSTSHPLGQNLEYLCIGECSKIIRLAPPSASFKNLASMEVKDCNALMYLMTSYTAKSLVHLTSLTVSNCGMLEEVVMTDEGELEKEITFESLKDFKLTGLSCLKSFCSGKHTFIFPSLVTLKVIGCHKMQNFSSGVINAPFLKLVELENGRKRWKEDLNTTIEQLFINKAIGGVEGDYKESSIINKQNCQTHLKSVSTSRALCSEEDGAESKADDIVDSGKQEKHKLPIPRIGLTTHKTCEISETPMYQASQNTLSLTEVDAAIVTAEINKTIQTPFIEAYESTLTHTSVQESAIDLSPLLALEVVTSSIQDGALQNQEMHENSVERPLVQSTKIAPSPTTVYDADGSQDSQLRPNENLLIQATTSIKNDDKKTVGTQETHESKRRFSVPDAQNVLCPTIVDDTGKSDDPEIVLESNLSSQTTNSVMAEDRATIDPSSSQASKAPSSSTTTVAADVCSSFKELDISEQLLPYLEAGVKQHPQVLDWLNTKRRRVFASSSFSLFAEVTRTLRSTQRGHLTEDDRNYIKECCTVLQGVSFDESWIRYVHGFIEECGDGEDLIKREVEENEGQASNLKAQLESLKKELASMKESLVLLHDRAPGCMSSSNPQVSGFFWKSSCKNIFIFSTAYLIMCLLISSLSNIHYQ